MISADISFSYSDGTEIFSSFRFSIPSGGKLRIISDPGSGKTTLARILTGSVPSYSGGMLQGRVLINGKDILSIPSPLRLSFAGRVSQNTDEMMLFSSIEEEIAFPLMNLGLSPEEIREKTEKVIALFGLESLCGVPASELSGGEKRRLMLAVLFAVDPELYILDESFDELSPAWRRRLLELIAGSERSFLILGSHEIAEYGELPGDVIAIEKVRAVPYERKPLPACLPALSPGMNELSCSDLFIRRLHRSASGSPFTLAVPSFSLRGGECVVITGENGAGKSSFSRVLCGLLEEESGCVSLNGRMMSPKERRRNVAYLMQNPYEELFLPTVLDEAKSTGAADDVIAAAIRRFHLDPEWYTAEISYGRAKLLQAMLFHLLGRPFAVFDEFDSSLTYSESLGAVEAYLSSGAGVVVITHDMTFASLLPGRHMSVKEGILS